MSDKYISKLTRRTTLKWLGTMAAATAVGSGVTGCAKPQEATSSTIANNWPDLKLKPITENRYGTDPNLINPTTPWPLTLTDEQRDLIARLCEIICPADEHGPSANSVGVPEVIDEWISAPYSRQQKDRLTILSGLMWLDGEAEHRFSKTFLKASVTEQIEIIDDIAYRNKKVAANLKPAVSFFSTLRGLVLGAYFSSPEGMKDIGYIGNIPIAGDYPGPTPEAMEHLNKVLAELNFKPYSV